MPIKDRAYLKSRFETGDIPTGEDFADIMDSHYSKADDAVVTSINGFTPSSSGGETEVYVPNLEFLVTQANHGFTVGQILFRSGAVYALASASAAETANVAGVVSVVVSANQFRILLSGRITGLSGLTPNTLYYLSAATPGAMVADWLLDAATSIVRPVLTAETATQGYFFNSAMTQIKILSSGSVMPPRSNINFTGGVIVTDSATGTDIEVIGTGSGSGGTWGGITGDIAQQTDLIGLVTAAASAIVSDAPSGLDTLGKISTALGGDPAFAATVTDALNSKADFIHSHEITGVAFLQETLDSKQASGDYLTSDAATAAVVSVLGDYATQVYVNDAITASKVMAIKTIADNYEVIGGDHTLLCSGNITITMPEASGNYGRVVVIKKIDAAGTQVDIVGYVPTELVENGTSAITAEMWSVMLQCDGTNWWIIAEGGI